MMIDLIGLIRSGRSAQSIRSISIHERHTLRKVHAPFNMEPSLRDWHMASRNVSFHMPRLSAVGPGVL